MYAPSIRGSGKAIIEFTSGDIFGLSKSEWEDYEVTYAGFSGYAITNSTATNASNGTVQFRPGMFAKKYNSISNPSNNSYESEKMGDNIIYPDGTTNVKGRNNGQVCPPQFTLDITNMANAWTTGAQTRYGMQITGSGDGNMSNYQVMSTNDLNSYSDLAGCSYGTDSTRPHFSITYKTKVPIPDDLPMDKTTLNIRSFSSTNASQLLNRFQAISVDGQVRPKSQVDYRIVEDKANRELVRSSSYSKDGNKRYPKYHDKYTINSYPKQVQGYYRLNSNYQEAADILASSSSFKQNTLYQSYYSAQDTQSSAKLNERKGDSFLIYQVKDYETIPRILAFYGIKSKSQINQFYIDNNSRDLLFVKENLIFIRNPKQNQNKAYVAEKPLSNADKTIIDHALVGANHACVYGNEPINYNTGNFYYQTTDTAVYMPDNVFEIKRVYNSMMQSNNFGVGANWNFSFNSQIYKDENGNYNIVSPITDKVSFTKEGDNYVSAGGTLKVVDTGQYEEYTVDKDYYIDGKDDPITEQVKMKKYKYEYTAIDKTVYTYDTYGYITSIKYPKGNDEAKFIYNINGQLTSIVLNDKIIDVEYDELSQNISKLIFENNSSIQYKYDEYGNLVEITDQNGDKQNFSYNTSANEDYLKNLMTSYNTSRDNTTVITNTYDKYGRVIKQVDENNKVTTLDYTESLTTITNDDGIKQYVYKDPTTLATTKYIDEKGKEHNQGFDTNLNMTKEVNAKDEEIVYTYNDNNYITQSENKATGVITTYSYDSNNNITKVDNGTDVLTYTYDSNSNLTSETDKNGNIASYVYNSNNKLIKETTFEGIVINYIYDSNGNKTKGSSNKVGDVTFTYNKLGQTASKTTVTKTENSTINTTTNYSYDKRGQLVSEETEKLKKLYTYNADGLKDSETVIDKVSNTNQTTSYTYDNLGNVLSTNDGLSTTYNTYDFYKNITNVKVYDNKDNSLLSETTNNYDNKQNLVEKIENGRSTKYTYDEKGNNLTETNNVNQIVFTKEYNTNNKITKQTDISGEVTTYKYDSNGNLSEEKYKDDITSYLYDDNNNVIKKVNPNGSYTTTTYDSLNNKTSETFSGNPNKDGDESTTTYEYSNTKLVSETNELGYTKSFGGSTLLNDEIKGESGNNYDVEYDSDANVTKMYNEGVLAQSKIYDGRGNVISETDGNNNTTTYTYDNHNRLVKTTYPNNTFTETVYDSQGRSIKETNVLGNSKYYEYDKYGNVVKEIDERGNVTTNKYNELNQKVESIDIYGNKTSFEYDVLGNNFKQIDDKGNVKTSLYEGESLVEKDETGIKISKSDNENHLIKTEITKPNGNKTPDNYDQKSVKEYDYYDNLVKETDNRNNSVVYGYNLSKQKILEIDPIGNKKILVYDSNGNQINEITSTTQSKVQFNNRGLVKTVTDNNDNVISFNYDNEGNIVKQNAYGVVTTYDYDNMGNVTKTCENERCTSSVYNELNQLVSEVDANNNPSFKEYNNFGDLVKKIDKEGYVTTYEYDKYGRQTKVVYPTGDSVENIYDKNSNVVTIKENNKVVKTNSYNKYNQLSSSKDGNNNVTKYYYDGFNQNYKVIQPNGRIDITNYNKYNDEVKKSEGNVVVSTTSYDKYGRELNTTSLEEKSDKQYDRNSNVISETKGNKQSVKTTYDKNGNKIKDSYNNGNVITYEYNKKYELVSSTFNNTTEKYTYNAFGEKLTVTSAKGEVTANEYDNNGNVISYSDSLGKEVYTYDKNNKVSSATDVRGNTTKYVNDYNGNVIKETDPYNNSKKYVYDYNSRLLKTIEPTNKVIVNSYDKNGNVVKTTTQLNPSKGSDVYRANSALITTQFKYDSMNNNIQVVNNDNSRESYSYDKIVT